MVTKSALQRQACSDKISFTATGLPQQNQLRSDKPAATKSALQRQAFSDKISFAATSLQGHQLCSDKTTAAELAANSHYIPVILSSALVRLCLQHQVCCFSDVNICH